MRAGTSDRLPRLIPAIPRRLASVKVGSALIVALLAFALAAAFFPGIEAAGFVRRVGQALDLDSLSRASALTFQERFESPPFIALVFVLGLSLCFSLFFRVRAELRRRRSENAALGREAGGQRPGGPAGAAVAAAERALRQRGYRTRFACPPGAWKVRGEKGDVGVWGSVLFHIGILLIMAAVVLTTSASFEASVKLTEGQAFDARVDKYGVKKAGRWYSPPSQPLTFRLKRVEADYDVNGSTTVASIVEPTLEGRASRFLEPSPVYISHGLHYAGMTIHQGRAIGYAPLVVVLNAAGKPLLQGYLQLTTVEGSQSSSFVDYFTLKDKDARIDVELLPDAVYRNGAYVSRSGTLKSPVLHAIMHEHGKLVLDRFIPATRNVSAGGYTVFFGGVRRWSQLDISDAPGVPVLVAGSLLGLLGLALRLLYVRRRIVVVLRQPDRAQAVKVDVGGSSEKFQRLFEEELGALRAALAAPEPGGTPILPSAAGGRE